MAKTTSKGFSRNVYINNPIYNEGRKKRELSEAAQLAEEIKEPNILYEQVASHLKPLILQIVERAFRRFCQGHKIATDEIEIEWKHFKKILNGML